MLHRAACVSRLQLCFYCKSNVSLFTVNVANISCYNQPVAVAVAAAVDAGVAACSSLWSLL